MILKFIYMTMYGLLNRDEMLGGMRQINDKKMKKGFIAKNSITVVLAVVSVCCLIIVSISVLKLPDVTMGNKALGLYRTTRIRKVSGNMNLGKFGKMMIEMLPEDLAFTVFIPSERAFERDLRLSLNDSFVAERMNDTYAIVSRILSFSAVPRPFPSVSIPFGKEISYDSISGYTLYISKDEDGQLVVNKVRSEFVDIRKGKIVVHIMDGVIMDADFEHSVQPDEA